MTDAEFDKAIAQIERILAKWRRRLGLYTWSFRYHYFRGPIERDGCGPNGEALAETVARYEYMKADIYLNVRTWTLETKRHQVEALVHELVHVVVNEMGPHGPGQERVVTQLTGALLRRYR